MNGFRCAERGKACSGSIAFLFPFCIFCCPVKYEIKLKILINDIKPDPVCKLSSELDSRGANQLKLKCVSIISNFGEMLEAFAFKSFYADNKKSFKLMLCKILM